MCIGITQARLLIYAPCCLSGRPLWGFLSKYIKRAPHSSFNLITQLPTMSPSYIKSGIGGVGNFQLRSSFSESASSPLLPVKAPSSSFSTGIGGASNYRRNQPSSIQTHIFSSSPPAYVGIGGAGNRNSYRNFPNVNTVSASRRTRANGEDRKPSEAASTSSSDNSVRSSLRSKITTFKEQLVWRSNRILEVGLDEAVEGGKPGYAQLAA